MRITTILLVALAAAACAGAGNGPGDAERIARAEASGAVLDTALFAGGCFWCMEPPFDAMEGVIATTSGFTGGHLENPTYRQVTAGGTGHIEAVRVIFDPARISYEELLPVFWQNIDPLDGGGQFCDRGAHYRSGIFPRDPEQRRAAEASKAALEESGRLGGLVVTEITDASAFWEAEDYHQGYYRKNPVRYRVYRANCGRDRRLAELWEGNG